MKKMKTFHVPCVAITCPTLIEVKAHSLEDAMVIVQDMLDEEGGEEVLGYGWSDFPSPEVYPPALKWNWLKEKNNA